MVYIHHFLILLCSTLWYFIYERGCVYKWLTYIILGNKVPAGNLWYSGLCLAVHNHLPALINNLQTLWVTGARLRSLIQISVLLFVCFFFMFTVPVIYHPTIISSPNRSTRAFIKHPPRSFTGSLPDPPVVYEQVSLVSGSQEGGSN